MADWRHHRIRRALLTALQPIGRTKPDLDLIEQVEQVTTLVLEGPARRFAPDSEHGDHMAVGPRIYNSNCGFGCYFAAETARSGRGRPFAKSGPAMLAAPPGGSNEPGHWASESLARQIR